MSQRVWDMIVSSVISIAITIVFGYYFLYVGEKQREPTFFVDPVKTMIIDQSNAADAPLQLLKANHDTITSDVVSAYFYFFNQGLETIKQENIYSPLRIKLDSGEILYHKIIKTSRNVSGITLSRDTINNALQIDFKALEKDDGFIGQLIYEGKADTPIILEGGIDGVKEFKSEMASLHPVYVVAAFFIFFLASYILLILKTGNAKSAQKFLFILSAVPVLYVLLMLYKTEWFVRQRTPDSLRIEQLVNHQTREIFTLPSWMQ